MASTSTGYAKAIITREQPSSSGQVISFTSGCMLNIQGGAVQKIKSDGEVELKSGSTMNVESGGSFNLNAGAIMKVSVVSQSSAALSMARTGASVFSTEVAIANTITIDGAPMAGLRKTIISYTTLAQTIRACSAVASKIWFGGSSSPKYFSIVVTPTAAQQSIGTVVELIGQSTSLWNVLPRSTAHIAFSTACT